jgi:hypothetical protein
MNSQIASLGIPRLSLQIAELLKTTSDNARTGTVQASKVPGAECFHIRQL